MTQNCMGYATWETFRIANTIELTETLRKGKRQVIRTVAKDNGAKVIGPSLVASFVNTNDVLHRAGLKDTTGVNFTQLAEEWTAELQEV